MTANTPRLLLEIRSEPYEIPDITCNHGYICNGEFRSKCPLCDGKGCPPKTRTVRLEGLVTPDTYDGHDEGGYIILNDADISGSFTLQEFSNLVAEKYKSGTLPREIADNLKKVEVTE